MAGERAKRVSCSARACRQHPPLLTSPIELDHVVAMIGSNVILQSDVEQEMHLSALEPLLILPGQNTPDSALRRLIDRTLILQQMEQQQQPTTTPGSRGGQVAGGAAEANPGLRAIPLRDGGRDGRRFCGRTS